jgi:hypothetical protein
MQPPSPDEAAVLRAAEQVARELGGLFARLAAGADPERRAAVARFTIACGFTLFAEDIGLLPERWFRAALTRPADLADALRAGWGRLAEAWGPRAGPLRDVPVPALGPADLAALAAVDASAIEPSIFGTLVEQSLRAGERARLGAHFTPRAYIERLVEPTILEPLRGEWRRARDDALRRRDPAPCRAFHARLCGVTVLDPACGAGNFLYVAMDLLKRLEAEVLATLAGLGAPPPAARVGPAQLFGVEKQPWSREIAGLALWVGALRWQPRDLAPPPPGNLALADAVLEFDAEEPLHGPDGRPAVVTRQGKAGRGSRAARTRLVGARPARWPDVEFIVGNPPFVGNKRMRERLGDGYVEALRAAYGGGDEALPGDVDYVAYWWHKAALQLRDPSSRLRRFGFIATNSLRQRQSGAVLRRHLGRGVELQFACPDHPWVDPGEELGGAAVRICMTVARRADEADAPAPRFVEDRGARRGPPRLHETRGRRINPDLTVGADLTAARPLAANAGLCFQGMNLVGDGFRLDADEVRALVGRARPPALRRYVQGRDLRGGADERHVIDFFGLDEADARAAAPALFDHLARRVRPLRAGNRREAYARRWWQFGEPRPRLRLALAGLPRYIATPETSAHRFFVTLDADVVPDHQIYVVAAADGFVLGVLSSRAHTAWAARAGGSNGQGNDTRWTSSATFDPFPFPDPTAAQRRRISALADELERVRADALRAHRSLTAVYHRVERARRGEPADEPTLALRRVHDELDRAVLAAYDFPADEDTDALLGRLLALNLRRAAEEAAGEVRWLRPGHQAHSVRR